MLRGLLRDEIMRWSIKSSIITLAMLSVGSGLVSLIVAPVIVGTKEANFSSLWPAAAVIILILALIYLLSRGDVRK